MRGCHSCRPVHHPTLGASHSTSLVWAGYTTLCCLSAFCLSALAVQLLWGLYPTGSCQDPTRVPTLGSALASARRGCIACSVPALPGDRCARILERMPRNYTGQGATSDMLGCGRRTEGLQARLRPRACRGCCGPCSACCEVMDLLHSRVRLCGHH